MSHKILVVEDNSATRRAIRNALTRKGHTVLEAADGATACELMRREHPVVVVQDLVLPDADGFELVGELRRLAGKSTVSILAFSGFVPELFAQQAGNEFDDIISKPIAPSRLVPIIEAHLPREDDTAQATLGQHRRLLLADDDPAQLKLASFRLSRLGFRVTTCANGREAYAAALASPPDLIVSDVMMPELDGFGLAVALRQNPTTRDVPLVLVTSTYVEASDRQLALRAGANDLVVRSPELRELIERLRTLDETPVAISEPLDAATLPAFERDHLHRVRRQLERHVVENGTLAKRCAVLSSELAVLTNITDTVLEGRDLNAALDESLGECLDAGGLTGGVLYLRDAGGHISARQLGTGPRFPDGAIDQLFGLPTLMNQVVLEGKAVVEPFAPTVPDGLELLRRADATAVLVMPLGRRARPYGALMMYSRAEDPHVGDLETFVLGVARQVTQVLELAQAYAAHRKAEEKSREHAALLDAVVHDAPDAILQVDRRGAIRFINRDVGELKAQALIGKPWFDFLTEPGRGVVREAFDRAMATATAVEVEATFGAITYAIRIGPVRDDGSTTGAVVIARDVSDRKQAEMKLLLADRMVSVGTLATGVAHEINNPLAAVLANLAMMSDDLDSLGPDVKLPEEFREELHDSRLAAERVRNIVRDLKIFSRAEEERLGPIDLEDVLESTLRMASNELRHRAVVVKDYGGVGNVVGNESRLGQVFLNLLINAAHAITEGNQEGNQITVSTQRRGANVIVTIADTGAGIPMEARPRLFTPFFTTKPVGIGTGLGLAISMKIVNSFGGTITFDSEVGRGTAFHVVLPASALPDVAPATIPERPLVVRRGKILVVDDDETLGQAVHRFLSRHHDVVFTASARSALTRIEQGERFDVVLCDLMMPQVTGVEFYEQVVQRDPEQAARFVFVTGGAFTVSARDFLDRTSVATLAKPFDLRELRSVIEDLLRSLPSMTAS